MLCWTFFFFAFQARVLNLCLIACVYFSPKNCFLSEMKQQRKFCECADDLHCIVNLFNKTFRLLLIKNIFVNGDWVVNCFLSSVSYYFDAMMFAFVFKLGETFHRAFPRINHNVAFEVSGVFGAFMSTSSCWEMSSWKCLTFKE